MGNRAVFLERNSIMVGDGHCYHQPGDFELLPSIPEAISLLNRNNFKVVVITNQPDGDRNDLPEETLTLNKKLGNELKKCGARIDAIYHDSRRSDSGDECQKPGALLFRQAARELDIELRRSFVIGDGQIDMDAGKTLGCKTVLITNGQQAENHIAYPPDYTADTLLQAAQWVVEEVKLCPATSVIVPAYDEEEGLPMVLEKIFKVIDKRYEVLVVDDGSTDRTAEVASKFPVGLIRYETNMGKGEALKTGVARARGENIIWIDADDTYPAELLPQITRALGSYDVVVCSRKYGRSNIPLFNRFGNFIFRTLIKGIYGSTPYDPCSGLYATKKRHLEAMELSAHRFAIEPEISIKGSRMKLKMLDIPIEYQTRVGDTKLNGVKVGFEDLITILKLVFWQPGRRWHE